MIFLAEKQRKMNMELVAAVLRLCGDRICDEETRVIKTAAKPGRGECQEHDGRSALVLPMHADENSIFLVDIGVEDDDGNVQWVKWL